MSWLMTVIFTTLFSYLGWAIGEPMGIGAALFLSLLGLIAGWLAARRFMAWLNA